MPLGDSTNWDEKAPSAAAMAGKTTLDVSVCWRNSSAEYCLSSRTTLLGGEQPWEVAEKVAKDWNDQNPHGQRAVYDLRKPQKVRFEGGPSRIRACTHDGTGPNYKDVEFGVKLNLYNAGELCVFKA